MIAFEYPLTEKSRSYLRFECLFLQIKQSISLDNDSDAVTYFKSLFELIELSDRSDIRHDLIKDLRSLLEEMQSWLSSEQADTEAIKALMVEISELISALLVMSKQLKFFKDSRFLTSLKQRFFIPGGCCNFDLPQFHFWSSQPIELKREDAKQWFEYFTVLDRALSLFLKMRRHQGIKSKQQAKNGFFQGEVEHALFIILSVDPALQAYPMISGHKHRYSVRFMNANAENSQAENIEFEQTFC
ncbi:cell division protein ZapD [Psychromonas sp. SP041]|uniref:cell division protein ZapD n=1 Tax=Psychromonas sp. SP041 TaxID=1365007 RepID=UPI0010C797B5|nr:cell division protein ZapD [Psychromonas sp. SP041]